MTDALPPVIQEQVDTIARRLTEELPQEIRDAGLHVEWVSDDDVVNLNLGHALTPQGGPTDGPTLGPPLSDIQRAQVLTNLVSRAAYQRRADRLPATEVVRLDLSRAVLARHSAEDREWLDAALAPHAIEANWP